MTGKDLTDILAKCLDSIERGERTVEECLALYPEYSDELSSLLSTAATVWEHADYAPRPGFRLSSRARLLRRLPARQNTAHRKPQESLPLFRRWVPIWTSVLVLIVSLIGGATVYASNNALPGDPLFPVKLTIEDTRLLFADDAKDVVLAAGFAQLRVEEIQTLIRLDREEDLEQAVGLFSNRITAASDSLAAVAQTDPALASQMGLNLEQALSRHTERLNQLLETVPEAAKPAIENAIRASNRGQGAIQRLIEKNQPGGPPENIPGLDDSPRGGPPEENPGANPPDGAPPENSPDNNSNPPGGAPHRTPGPPTWAPGGKP